MNDPHPWRPDPSDQRIPIAPPDTISVNPSGRAGQVGLRLAMENRNHMCRSGALAAILGARLFFRFHNESIHHVLRQVKKSGLVHLMHRPCADGIQATLAIPNQAFEDGLDVFIARMLKRIVRNVDRSFKKLIGLFFIHRAIVSGSLGLGHSYFPCGIAMSSSSLFLPKPVFTYASKFLGRGW